MDSKKEPSEKQIRLDVIEAAAWRKKHGVTPCPSVTLDGALLRDISSYWKTAQEEVSK